MPYFTRQTTAGRLIVDAVLGISLARNTALVAANQPIPRPLNILALVDTGASCTCVDNEALQQLQLTPTGSTPVLTPSTGKTPMTADQYDVSLMFYSTTRERPLMFHTIPVLQTPLIMQGFHALIGMDVLRNCLLVYDGRNDQFSLAF